jgi:hypothetical protein
MVKEKPVKLGAEEWKKIWPEAIWPGVLPEAFPAAALTIMRVNYNNKENNAASKVEFDMPLVLNLIFGGAFGEDVSFLGEWSPYTAGKNAAGLQRLFFQLNDLFSSENLLNFRFGRFEPGITDGYTNSQKLSSASVITGDFNPGGGWKARDPQSGIELNGILYHRIYYAAGVVNGESKTIGDLRDRKDVYTRLAYQFGGYGYDALDFPADSGAAMINESILEMGVYSYWGSRDKIPLDDLIYNSSFIRTGIDINLLYGKLNLLGGFVYGTDDNLNNESEVLKSTAYFVEGNYNIYPWLIGLLRLEKTGIWRTGADIENAINIIPNITFLYRANIRFSIEGFLRIDLDREINGSIIPAENTTPLQTLSINSVIAF